ncbi:TVP38/TMEM64 family protein [Allostella humosa]|uniref:TVP38/TMEM64 family protein n=1 Tax=Stella humosa TaxID=94 RepID=UPI001477309D|nr:VTT domain-containing protein [Stella humosa]
MQSTPEDTRQPPACHRPPCRSLCRLLWPVGLLVVLAAAVFLLGLHRYLTFASLQAHRGQLQAFAEAHALLAGLAGFAIYAGVVALSIPGAVVLTVTLGFLFGTVVGGAIAAAGALVGATAVFLLARSTVGAALSERAGPWVQRMEAGLCRDAFSYLLALRLAPIFPFCVVNLVPALLGVPTRTYVLATAIGILPGTFVFAAVGAGLGSVLDSEEGLTAALMLKREVVLALGGLALLTLLSVAYRRYRRRC